MFTTPVNPRMAPVPPGDTGWVLGAAAGQWAQASADEAWTNVNNVIGSTSVAANLGLLKSNEESNWIQIANFGFTVPDGANITEVHFQCDARERTADVPQQVRCQMFNGLNAGVLLGNPQTLSGDTSERPKTYAPANTWGASLTPALVNSSDFCVGSLIYGLGTSTEHTYYYFYVKVVWA